MSADIQATTIQCPTCGMAMKDGMVCHRCLIGDVLAVVEGPTPPGPTPVPSGVTAQKRLGEYDLLEELGRGGMGVVWRANQRRLNRTVALKLVRGGCLPGEAAARRFRREAEAAAQLKHPNIVTIHEVGEYDDQLFLSMDLVEGGSLADWLKRVAFSPEDAATLVAKVARGVHHAHENNIIHRDLKPGNILLDVAGEPRVCDFGLARIVDSASSLTVSGELLGTPAYIAPEQASGRGEITPACDTYSLGAILYEMLCGHPPFTAENLPALLRKVAEDDPMRPLSHHSGGRIPFDLSTICLKCLEKEPQARYSSALALAEDLERWLRDEPIVARPVARVERLWKWVRRKPVLAALWLGITLLLVIIAITTTVASIRIDAERRAVSDLAEASRHQVARQLSESAQRYLNSGDYHRALPGLAEAIRIGSGDPRIDEADRIRFGVLLRASPQLAHAWFHGEPLVRAETTYNGERLLAMTPSVAEVWETTPGTRVGSDWKLPALPSNAIFDHDGGRWVLVECEGKLLVWYPDTGEHRDLGPGHIFSPPDGFSVRGPRFASYYQRLAEVRTITTGERVAGPFLHEADIQWAVVLPDSDRVMSADINGTVYLWDLKTGTHVTAPFTPGKTKKAISIDAYHAGQRVAALHRERDCWLVDCQTGKVVLELLGADDSPQTIGWDDTGRWFFLARNNDGVTLRYLENDTIRWSWDHHGLGFRGAFAPIVGLVATQSWNGSARIWRTSSGRPASPFLWQTATPGSCILDPQGRWFLSRGDKPAARFWQLRAEDGATIFPEIIDQPVQAWVQPQPERLVVADSTGRVRSWRTERPIEKVNEVKHPEDKLVEAGRSADARRFFTAGPQNIQVWDAEKWAKAGPSLTPGETVIHAAISPNGSRIAAALASGRITVFDSVSGEVVVRIEAGAQSVSFSPDGRLLLVIGEMAAHTWDAASGKPVSSHVEQSRGQIHARFSPDGRKVLQWSGKLSPGQANARIWDAATGKILTELPAHWQGVGDAAWSPDGKMVATGGADQMLLVSDAETGSQVTPPALHGQKISAVGFSKDGQLMWSLAEKEIIVWHTVTGEPVTPPLRQVRSAIKVVMSEDDGRDLTVVGERAAPRMWNLHPDLRTPGELQSIAHVLSGHALVTGTSALRPLSLVELRASWESARKTLQAW